MTVGKYKILLEEIRIDNDYIYLMEQKETLGGKTVLEIGSKAMRKFWQLEMGVGTSKKKTLPPSVPRAATSPAPTSRTTVMRARLGGPLWGPRGGA